MIPLPALEEITDRSGIAPRIELLLPIGVRARQLLARTLLLGMLIVLCLLYTSPSPRDTR